MAVAHCGVFHHGQKNSRTLFFNDIVQISEKKKITYISTSGKAVLPHYLMQGRASFKLYFPFSASTNKANNISWF